jgi:hypothetical protein
MYTVDIRLPQTVAVANNTYTSQIAVAFTYLKQWPWPTTPTPARLSGSVHMYTLDIPLSQTVAVANYTYISQFVR